MKLLQRHCSADSKCLRHFFGTLLWILLNNLLRIDISKSSFAPDRFLAELEKAACDIETLELTFESTEVSFTIAGYIAKKLKKTYLHIMSFNS